MKDGRKLIRCGAIKNTNINISTSASLVQWKSHLKVLEKGNRLHGAVLDVKKIPHCVGDCFTNFHRNC